ncbi:MAG: S41 family peptidase [Leptospiraceae bacterium]|nr:S41 family peptidase [Leptospiraceae bacterium]MCP5498070.1 S41 family peptidase [Leptospiraceae bacterium]
MKIKERILWMVTVLLLLFIVIFHPLEKVKAISLEAEKYLQIFHEVVSYIETDYVERMDEESLYQGAIKGLISSLNDPHSRFMTQDEFKELQDETRGSFGGIGIEVTYQDKSIIVISPIDDTPAMRAGILPQDRIIEINGINTKKMSIAEAVKVMRGPVGSTISIKIKRKDFIDPILLTLVRELIKINYIKSSYMEKEKIGYIRLSQFMGKENTGREFEKIVKKFASYNPKGIIVDLRLNPGGLLDLAIDLSDLFLQKNLTIVSVKGRDGKLIKIYKATDSPKKVMDVPIVVLINAGSASASEIFAGALQDNKRAIILGTQSFGKGSVQNIYPLPHNTGMALTIQKYYTPSGVSIHKKGITPNVVVYPITPSDIDKVYLEKIYREKILSNFVEKFPGYNAKNKRLFKELLTNKGYNIGTTIVNYILKKENNLGRAADIYDTEFDPQLEKAIELILDNKAIPK